MNAQLICIIIAIVALAVILGLLVFLKKTKPQGKLSTLSIPAFAFLVAGIFLGENRIIGYILVGIGLVLAIIDIIKKFKK